jgi:hypothetical protein
MSDFDNMSPLLYLYVDTRLSRVRKLTVDAATICGASSAPPSAPRPITSAHQVVKLNARLP